MRMIIAKISATSVLLIIFCCSFTPEKVRTISIAGLVVDAETLAPVESTGLYDAGNNLLGTTDKNGYYKIAINYTKSGELLFSLKVKRKGYQGFNQNEHWGNFEGSARKPLGGTGSLYRSEESHCVSMTKAAVCQPRHFTTITFTAIELFPINTFAIYTPLLCALRSTVCFKLPPIGASLVCLTARSLTCAD